MSVGFSNHLYIIYLYDHDVMLIKWLLVLDNKWLLSYTMKN